MSTLISGDRQFMGTNTNPLYVVPLSHNFLNISSAGTNVVKSGAGTLVGIIMNKIVSLGVITIYDNTAASGTKIATITNPTVLLNQQMELPYGAKFTNGLTIVTSSTDDITVIYD